MQKAQSREARMQLNRHLVIKALGDVDEAVIAELLATGASAEEFAQAQAWLENDDPLLNSGKPLPRGRVAQVADILRTVDEENSVDPGRP